MARWCSTLCCVLLVFSCSDDSESEPDAGSQTGGVACNAHLADIPSLTYDATGTGGCHWTLVPGDDDYTALQTALVEVNPGETVCLGAGTFTVPREVNLGTPHVTIRGAGRLETILNFAEQTAGANGVHIVSDHVTVEKLTVQDTAGDGIRATGVKNIRFIEVGVVWTADQSAKNGAYALYPVQCDGVLIERSYVKGSRDAGIYVGQSRNILVKDNEAEGNVAGIEIENSFDAVVENNHAHDNTGGILVFNLPNLPQKNGERTILRGNLVEDNNLPNFGLPGTIVGKVPSGTGVLIMAADRTDVFDNTIQNNASFGVGILFYESELFGKHSDEGFDPYPEGNTIHDNTFANNGYAPAGITALIQEDTLADVIWGGCVDDAKDQSTGEQRNCMVEAEGTTYLNFDLCGGFQDKSRDPVELQCTQPSFDVPEPCATDGCPVAPDPTEQREVDPEVGCALPYPTLADYKLFQGDPAAQVPADGVHLYEVASELWSDGALKRRFIALPDGAAVGFSEQGLMNFPVGTTLVKTFSFPAEQGAERLIETRLLIREPHGWTPHTYVWNDEQTEARRVVAGREVSVSYRDDTGAEITHDYLVPSTAQCASCHLNQAKVVPLGPTTRQLNRPVVRGDAEQNQLTWLAAQGVFSDAITAPETLPANADPHGDADLDARARAYMDANCGHCHRAGGVAGSTGLWLDATETNDTRLGLCKTPVAAGAGAGDLTYDVVPGAPDESILVYRMESTEPGIKMPELPNLRVDDPGVALIREWIAAMPADDCK